MVALFSTSKTSNILGGETVKTYTASSSSNSRAVWKTVTSSISILKCNSKFRSLKCVRLRNTNLSLTCRVDRLDRNDIGRTCAALL